MTLLGPQNAPKMAQNPSPTWLQLEIQDGAQIWWPLGASWGVFGASWGRLGPSLGPSWGRLGASWGCLGASWARLAGILGRLRRVLERPGRVLGASWRVLRACSLFDRVSIDFSLQLRPPEPSKLLFFHWKNEVF